MRVVLFTDSDAFAGTEQHMLDLADGLEDLGVAVQIACPVPSAINEKAGVRGLGVVPIEKEGTIDISAIRRLRGLLKSGSVDVVHSHNGRTALSASIAVRLVGRGACVATQHFLQPHRLSRRGVSAVLSRMAHSWVNRGTGQFVAISQSAREGMIERKDARAERISVVHNGIADPRKRSLRPSCEVRAELGIETGSILIVCAARLEPEKDVGALISALVEVRKRHPRTRCVIAGVGSLESALREQIRAADLDRNVCLLGFRADAIEVINACDVFVLPSIAEPFGLVILEAMALGKPVVATAAGGPKEIVVHGRTGFLVAPRSPVALGDAISELIAQPEARILFGNEGRKRFEEKFTALQMAARTIEVYREALSRSRNNRTVTSGRVLDDVRTAKCIEVVRNP